MITDSIFRIPGFVEGTDGVLGVLLYYILVWFIVGRDPAKRTIIPTWEPPDGLSPAALRYILTMRVDGRSVTAAITSAVLKGFATIGRGANGVYTLKRRSNDYSALSEDERILLSKLLFGRRLMLTPENAPIVKDAVKVFKKSMKSKHTALHFRRNYLCSAIGVIASVAVAATPLRAFLESENADQAFGPMVAILMLAGFSIPMILTMRMESQYRRLGLRLPWVVETHAEVSPVAKVVINTLFIGAFLWMVVGLSYLILASGSAIHLVPLGLLLIINYAFFRLLKRYTREGQELLSRILGFRAYLETAVRDEIEGGFKKTELHRVFLAYAIALDVEQQWAEELPLILDGWVKDLR